MNSYEFLKYMTVHMEGTCDIDMLGEEMESSATGFYVKLNINGELVPVIVTAKHFANSSAMTTFTLHYIDNNNIVTLPITMPVRWILSEYKDIAYCEVRSIEEKFKKITGHSMFYTAIKEDDIVSEDEYKNINILSEVVMLGYPKGKGSTHHKYPLFKKGYLASSPSDFYENNMGYVDISSISGYSGSPLILNNSTLKLVGVLVQTFSEEDKKTRADMGMYVNADCILEFKKNFS